MRSPNYQDSKTYNAKHFHALFSLESYRVLRDKSQELGMSMTRFLEYLLENYGENLCEQKLDNRQNTIDRVVALINLNHSFYKDLNATFSNLNQIAIRLNIANLVGDEALEELRNDESLHTQTQKQLIEATENILLMRDLTKKILAQLQTIKKGI